MIFKQVILFIVLNISYAFSLEKELTINISPGSQDCFYQSVKPGEVIDLEYQVIDGGHGDLDISFQLVDPTGRIQRTDYKKSENNHRVDVTVEGDYRFCFDNTFSSYNSKTVFFELIIDNDDEDNWETQHYDVKPEDVYDVTVQEINDAVLRVKNHISKIRQLQDIIKSTEARDRNTAEENYFKVNAFSFVQIMVMITVAIIQVVMVRSLFDDNSKVRKLWKGFNFKSGF